MKNNIKATVITAVFNGEATIARTIESVLNQTYRNIEYLIIDGASKDRTVEIAESYKEQFKEAGIEYSIYSEPDDGIYDAMNKGISKATGQIVGLINSDDWYEPEMVEHAVAAYEKEGYGMYYADLRIVDGDNSFIKHSKDSKWVTSRYWNHPTTFITKDIYDRHKYKTENIHDDWDLILQIRKEGVKVVVDNTVLANFTRNGVSHEKSWKKAMERAGIKYYIYRDNNFSRLYWFECYGMEIAKMLI